jgi:hypothetical protein
VPVASKATRTAKNLDAAMVVKIDYTPRIQ